MHCDPPTPSNKSGIALIVLAIPLGGCTTSGCDEDQAIELTHEFISQHEATAESGYSTEQLDSLLAVTSERASELIQEDADWYQSAEITQVGSASIESAQMVDAEGDQSVAVEVVLDSSDVHYEDGAGQVTETVADRQTIHLGIRCEPEWSIESISVLDDGVNE